MKKWGVAAIGAWVAFAFAVVWMVSRGTALIGRAHDAMEQERAILVDFGDVPGGSVQRKTIHIKNELSCPVRPVLKSSACSCDHSTVEQKVVGPGEDVIVTVVRGFDRHNRARRADYIGLVCFGIGKKENRHFILRIQANVLPVPYEVFLDPERFTVRAEELAEGVVRRRIVFREYFGEDYSKDVLEKSESKVTIRGEFSPPDPFEVEIENEVPEVAIQMANAFEGRDRGLRRVGNFWIELRMRRELERENTFVTPIVFMNSLVPDEVVERDFVWIVKRR